MRFYPKRNFKKRTVYDFVKKLNRTGSIDRSKGSGRPRSAVTNENEEQVLEIGFHSPHRKRRLATVLAGPQLHRLPCLGRIKRIGLQESTHEIHN